ncbi:hypothetical protein M8818_004279 [Zalaria obscura]|uniref:Uncharacterized protein n=1 Tax=Zalaria obscura TaxID=2024903 RepID=A0ACC3SGM0_9PEZI
MLSSLPFIGVPQAAPALFTNNGCPHHPPHPPPPHNTPQPLHPPHATPLRTLRRPRRPRHPPPPPHRPNPHALNLPLPNPNLLRPSQHPHRPPLRPPPPRPAHESHRRRRHKLALQHHRNRVRGPLRRRRGDAAQYHGPAAVGWKGCAYGGRKGDPGRGGTEPCYQRGDDVVDAAGLDAAGVGG